MAKKSSKGEARLLTEVELELMTLLWSLGEGTVHDVISALPTGRKLAYTSVSTMLRILEGKGDRGKSEGRPGAYLFSGLEPR